MPIETILSLIARYGIPLAEKIYDVVTKHGAPTAAMWAELKLLNDEWTMEKYLEEAAAKKAAGGS